MENDFIFIFGKEWLSMKHTWTFLKSNISWLRSSDLVEKLSLLSIQFLTLKICWLWDIQSLVTGSKFLVWAPHIPRGNQTPTRENNVQDAACSDSAPQIYKWVIYALLIYLKKTWVCFNCKGWANILKVEQRPLSKMWSSAQEPTAASYFKDHSRGMGEFKSQ